MFNIRHFFTNLLCGIIPGARNRNTVRAFCNTNNVYNLHFIRKNTGFKHIRIKHFVGYRGLALTTCVNNKYAYKFQIRKMNKESFEREKIITDEFRKISHLYIPKMEIFPYAGKFVRRYEYINGTTIRKIKPKIVKEMTPDWAHSIAKFLFEIGMYDPKTLYKYKTDKNAKPGYMYGWYHGDIYDNFMIDKKTNKILAVFDWEDVRFDDFSNIFQSKYPDQNEFMQAVRIEYDKIYKKSCK